MFQPSGAVGKISLLDMAGSERVKRSEVTGEAFKEAIAINKSLSALLDVIDCLVRPCVHCMRACMRQRRTGGPSPSLLLVPSLSILCLAVLAAVLPLPAVSHTEDRPTDRPTDRPAG
eukprot:SAG22_NODE_1508_length_4264_cov_2.094838_1_plen_117_part_00